jgi:cytochrome c oxidase cbb3-type subunit I/II
VLFVPKAAHGKLPLVWTPNNEYAGATVKIAAETDDLEALVAYVQKLGMNRGKWRDLFEPQQIEVMDATLPRSAEWIEHGKDVYERRCAGCHGVKGDGNGPAATFMFNQRPRNFNLGEFKFTLTGAGALPTDGDLLRTITRGVRGTAMPPWYDLPLNDRLAVIQYIKYVLAVDTSDPAKPESYFSSQPAGAPLYIEPPPAPSQEIVAHGKDVWENAKCWECHGRQGLGDGEKAPGLKDNLNFPIRPANLTIGQFKSGADVQDIYRTVSLGLKGTPMPAFRPALSDQDRWALSYYILSLSAFKDPISAAQLAISPTDRAALDNVKLDAARPEDAYVPHGDVKQSAAAASTQPAAPPANNHP